MQQPRKDVKGYEGKGTTYQLRPVAPAAATSKAEYPDFAARLCALKMPMVTKEQS
jgi:hypothetical protein